MASSARNAGSEGPCRIRASPARFDSACRIASACAKLKQLELDEKKFRYLFNEDAMATEKTAEGIRKFAADIAKLEKFVAAKLR